jgi:hypothetical protein
MTVLAVLRDWDSISEGVNKSPFMLERNNSLACNSYYTGQSAGLNECAGTYSKKDLHLKHSNTVEEPSAWQMQYCCANRAIMC